MAPRPQENEVLEAAAAAAAAAEEGNENRHYNEQQQQQQLDYSSLVRANHPLPVAHRNNNSINIHRHRSGMENNEAADGHEIIEIPDDETEEEQQLRLQQQQQQQQRQFLAIEDEGEWLRRYGLRGEPHYGAESYTNQKEAKQRVQDQTDYQSQIHARWFEKPTDAEEKRRAQLAEWSKPDQVVRIEAAARTTNDGGTPSPIECNLGFLASHSDTVFTMAETRPLFESSSSSNNNDVDASISSSPLLLSLHDYPREAVLQFLDLLKGISKKESSTNDKESLPPAAAAAAASLSDDHYVVECCQIAHYLQCNTLLDKILVPMLIQSVDSANCLSLCQLADQLHLPSLLEASVNHMMRSLGSVEEHDIWGDLTPELQNRIQAIQQILQSNNRRQLFFSSFDEYLALFAEQVDYYRERLEDAVHQQSQHPQESPGWIYAQSKIDQQRERVQILRRVLQEQKKLFRRPASSSPVVAPGDRGATEQ